MTENDWNPGAYDENHGFVSEYGRDLLDLLAPESGDRVLDVGCGTGHLTAEIAASGAAVIGIDAAPEMIEQARQEYHDLTFEQADVRTYDPAGQFDAVFSNAALHWIPGDDHDAVLSTVAAALGDDGRFVAELGGRGNVSAITDALAAELTARGDDGAHPWYFPSIGEYSPRVESHGMEVEFARLFDRPTELDGGEAGLRNWIEMVGDEFFVGVSSDERAAVLDGVEARVREQLWDESQGVWIADYRRLRFVAKRQ